MADTQCRDVTRLICNTTCSHLSHCKVNTTNSFMPVKHFFMPGGTMNITQGNIMGRIIKSGLDEYGR
eukprot:5107967-Ditylum_brightwellii.AAC.1